MVNVRNQSRAQEHAPLTKTALTLSKLIPVSSLRAHPTNRLIDKPRIPFNRFRMAQP